MRKLAFGRVGRGVNHLGFVFGQVCADGIRSYLALAMHHRKVLFLVSFHWPCNRSLACSVLAKMSMPEASRSSRCTIKTGPWPWAGPCAHNLSE